MSLIAAKNVSFAHGGRRVLDHVDLAVAPGEIVTIVGPNGSGKTTLLRLLIGALTPDSGTVTRAPGLRLGYVPQTLALDPSLPMTVDRFLALPKRPGKAALAEARARAGLSESGTKPLASLSGGQFQRVLLARALLNDPQLLILDEPTKGLDQPGSAQFYETIDGLRRELGIGVLMVSHELHVVMSASDRVVCLNGHVCCAGTPEVVANAPEYRALFGTGTHGALALYRHTHDHTHDHGHDHAHDTDRTPA